MQKLYRIVPHRIDTLNNYTEMEQEYTAKGEQDKPSAFILHNFL